MQSNAITKEWILGGVPFSWLSVSRGLRPFLGDRWHEGAICSVSLFLYGLKISVRFLSSPGFSVSSHIMDQSTLTLLCVKFSIFVYLCMWLEHMTVLVFKINSSDFDQYCTADVTQTFDLTKNRMSPNQRLFSESLTLMQHFSSLFGPQDQIISDYLTWCC